AISLKTAAAQAAKPAKRDARPSHASPKHRAHGASDEAIPCASGRSRPVGQHPFLLRAVRHGADRTKAGLCEVDAGRPTGQLCHFTPVDAYGPESLGT